MEKAKPNWVWIATVLAAILSCIILFAYGSKVYMGCSNGIYLAEIFGDPTLNPLDFRLIIPLGNDPMGITHEPETGDIYVTEKKTRIFRVSPEADTEQTVIELAGEDPTGIYIHNNDIYWTDLENKKIYRIAVDGLENTGAEFVSAPGGCWGIAEYNGFIYWVDYNSGSVKMAALEGSSDVIELTAEFGLGNARAITIDEAEMTLYAANYASVDCKIIRLNITNTNDQVTIYNNCKDIKDISILDGYLLFIDNNANPAPLKALHKKTGSSVSITITGLQDCTSHSLHVINEPKMTTPMTTTIEPTTTATDPTTTVVDTTTTPIDSTASAIATTATAVGPSTTKLDRSTPSTDTATTQKDTTTTTDIKDTPTLFQTDTTSLPILFHGDDKPGVFDNASYLENYRLFGLNVSKQDIQFVDDDITVAIPKEFIESGINGTGFLSVSVHKTPNDDKDYQEKHDSNIVYLLGSPLISVNLFDSRGNLVKHNDELNPLNIKFPIQATPKQTCHKRNLGCAFWDTKNNLWSQEGLITHEMDSKDKHQTCKSTHLTTFAVLFKFSKGTATNYSHVVAKFVTLGICISLLALSAGLFTCALLWRRTSLEKEKLFIHANLMTAMTCAYLFTLVSRSAKSYQVACHVVTILRYNTFLAVFCNMLVEALHMFRMIVIVFGIERNLRVAYVIIGWGFPLLMTIITAASGGKCLYDQQRCWLTDRYIWAFIAPVIIILTINLIILLVVVYKTLVALDKHDQDKVRSIRIGVRSAVLLLPMVGVTWLIGLLGNVNINVAYVFDFMSSLQGLYLVFITCFVNTEVRDALKREWTRRSGRVGQNLKLHGITNRTEDCTQDTTAGSDGKITEIEGEKM